MKIDLSLIFAKGYIAHPYWPEREKLINIQKASGLNRARTEANRKRALSDYLTAHNLTMDHYEDLERLAERPFYRWRDVVMEEGLDGRNPEGIVIPAHQLYGCLAQAASLATTSIRLTRPEQIRTVLDVVDFETGRTEADGIWEHFVVVTAGTGNRLSNQRALRSDPYLKALIARGSIRFSDDVTDEKRVRDFLSFAGREIGVGASRKLGWGRFTIASWVPASELAKEEIRRWRY